jgi:hypothetical protein
MTGRKPGRGEAPGGASGERLADRRLNLARVLHQELERLAPRYASLSVEHAPLVAYPTLASLVGRLTDREKNKSRAAQRERSELLSSIIGAYQHTRDRLWGALLVATFRPMLATKRFYGADPEEREAIFFAALTEVAGKLDIRERPHQVHAIVWRSAKKALVRKLRRQTTWSEVGFGDDADATPDATSWLPEPWLAAWLLSRTSGLGASELADAKDRPDIDLLVRVEEWGSLKAYVEKEHAALPLAVRSRVYGQLQRRHRRAVAQLREALAGAPERATLCDSVPPPESKTRLRPDLALAEEVAADAPVTCDHDGLGDMPVARDRHGSGDGAVTRDTIARAPCDRCACAPCEPSDFGSKSRALAAHTMLQEVLS